MKKVIKSHIYPESLVIKWFENFLLLFPHLKNLYIIDLDTNTQVIERIKNKIQIKKVLEKHKLFYLNLPNNNLTKGFEQFWNQDFENDFIIKVDQAIFKIINNEVKSEQNIFNSSFWKNIKYLLFRQRETIIKFFHLNLFRSFFYLIKK